jgi:hypothetical protein
MSQTLKQKMILSSCYEHNPDHFKFPRRLATFEPIEDCGGRGDKLVGVVAVILALILVLL